MAEGFEGMEEIQEAIRVLPERTLRTVARAWTRRWSAQAYAAAFSLAPLGKTGNLRSGLRRRDATARSLARKQSMARAVVIGAAPAYHFHWVVRGTAPRYDTTRKNAYRGRMPVHAFLDRASRPLMGPARDDLITRVKRALARFRAKNGTAP